MERFRQEEAAGLLFDARRIPRRRDSALGVRYAFQLLRLSKNDLFVYSSFLVEIKGASIQRSSESQLARRLRRAALIPLSSDDHPSHLTLQFPRIRFVYTRKAEQEERFAMISTIEGAQCLRALAALLSLRFDLLTPAS